MDTLWGIDLGGTKIEGVVLPVGSSEPLARLRIPTEASLGYEHIVGRIGEVVRRLEAETGLMAPEWVGVGTPGTVDPSSGLMKNCNTTSLNGRALPADLGAVLGRHVVVANDANCFALAEARLGAARDHQVVFGVIMGTGVGGGVVVEEQVLGGAQGIAGEWGHMIVDPDGLPCYCGRRGCVETILSGPSLERWYEERTGVRRSLREIASSGETDPDARATLAHLVAWFGRSISQVINVLDPDAIVLGGGVGNVPRLYEEGPGSAAEWVFDSNRATRQGWLRTHFLRPELGDSAGVFGAALLTAHRVS